LKNTVTITLVAIAKIVEMINTLRRSSNCLVLPILVAKRAGIINIQMLATDFIIAPTHPPANGPKSPTSGALMSKHRMADFHPNTVQHKIQGTAAKSIRINHGVKKRGGNPWSKTERGASIDAPAIFTVGLFQISFRIRVQFPALFVSYPLLLRVATKN